MAKPPRIVHSVTYNIRIIRFLVLDYDRLHFCPKETQQKQFERQFDLAESTRLPMFLHNRNTGEDFGKLVSQHRSRFTHGVVHSFTGSVEEMQQYLDLGLYIGINGWYV